MSEFLVVTPTAGKNDISDELKDHICSILEAAFSEYEKYAQKNVVAGSKLHSSASRYGTFAMSRTEDESLFVSKGDFWTISSDPSSSHNVHSNLRLIGGSLEYQQPVWGTYSAVFGDRYINRLFAWNTTPALEPIHYSSKFGFHFISNRPILIALALAQVSGRGVALSYSYLLEYLNYGYSLAGNTPFEDVLCLPINKTLKIKDGRLSLTEFPRGLVPDFSFDHDLNEGGEALANALLESTTDAVDALKDPRVQLRLSGGKDSRMLLGALKRTNANVRAVTYGTNSDLETHLASTLASMSGIKHFIGRPSFVPGNTTKARVRNVLSDCLGIPPSEAHLSQYKGSAPEFPGEAISLGQWPLWKGGMAKLLRNTTEYVNLMLAKQSSGILLDAYQIEHDDFLSRWSKNVSASSELEKLYLFAREFRSGLYMQSHVNHYSQDAKLLYPISDMRVTSICDRLSMAEKVSEKALFVALKKIWPESLNYSFHGSSWRFESGGADPVLSGDSYVHRMKMVDLSPAKIEERTADSVPGEGGELSKPIVADLCRELVELENWKFVSCHLQSDFVQNVVLVAAGEEQKYSEIHREFAKYVWRVFTACVWFSGSWIRD
ncbi:hypothetical protein [Glutamicibacter sp. NPDC087673]|uniref:hypothetical protein n=1 Tax=Glutamicibacter sp. NPDC087673 TaxID=3363997 RepID=UPI00382DD3D4